MREGWAAAEGGRNNEHTAVVSLSNLDKHAHTMSTGPSLHTSRPSQHSLLTRDTQSHSPHSVSFTFSVNVVGSHLSRAKYAILMFKPGSICYVWNRVIAYSTVYTV